MKHDINSFSVLELSHRFISENVHEGDLCIDATAGRGFDTAFLCECVGESGHIIAFDIQQDAIDSTVSLLKERRLEKRAEVILESHSNMDKYAEKGTVACITFNFGWLPGGNHSINTSADSSIEAISKGLELLKPDGVMSLCIYYGRETGFEERDALLEYFKTINSREYTVLVSQFVNRQSCPPIPVFIWKGK